jgi:hypothetical protein
MKYTKTNPTTNIPKQKPSPPAVSPFDFPLTIIERIVPSKKPAKLPIAKSKPAAVPYPTG